MSLKKRILLKSTVLAFSVVSGFGLSGCHMPVIFEQKKGAYEIEELSVDEIEENTYYVKSGTKFVAVYTPSGTVQSRADMPSSERIIYMRQKEAMIPTLYKGDTLVYKSTDLATSEITLERFKDCGYSFGIHNAVYDEASQLITFDRDNDVVSLTPADNNLSTYSDDIGIQTIGSSYVSGDNLDEAGNLTGLEKDNSYEIGYYAGTQYETAKLTADRHVLESWEMLKIPESSITKTKKGYLSISIPDDFKSGWYYIGDAGFFKYIDHAKGEGEDPEGDEMNIDYYDSEVDALSVYSQMYAVNFDKNTSKPTIEVIYNANSLTEGQSVRGFVIAPDGTQFEMVQSDEKPLIDDSSDTTYTSSAVTKAYLTCSLDQAMAGKWQVVLTPKTLSIIQVKVINNGLAEGATEVEKMITFDSAKQGLTFYGTWESEEEEPNLYGYFIYPDGTTYNFEYDKNKKMLTYEASYLPAGTYTIKMYHYSDSEMTEDDIGYTDDPARLDAENITSVSG